VDYLETRKDFINNTIRGIKNTHDRVEKGEKIVKIRFDYIKIDYMIKLIHAKCFYCRNHYDTLNGIDRYINKCVDNEYDLVSCCEMCNMMKKNQDAYEFVGNCRRIAIHYLGCHDLKQTIWNNKTSSQKFTNYVSKSKSRSKRFKADDKYTIEINEKHMNNLFSQSCLYCGEENANGIDRFDNDKGYTDENTVPCCSTCNYIKYIYDVKDWSEKIINIAYTTHYVQTTEFKNCIYCEYLADWESECDSEKTVCNWCLNNLLILGGDNYIKFCKNVYERDFYEIPIPESIKYAEYGENKLGLYTLYNNNGGVDDSIEAGEFVKMMRNPKKKCKMCCNYSNNKMVICKNVSYYSDINDVYVACKLCMVIKNGISLSDADDRIQIICDNYDDNDEYVDEDFIECADRIKSKKCIGPLGHWTHKTFKK
jgi:hypothetical protein